MNIPMRGRHFFSKRQLNTPGIVIIDFDTTYA